MSSWPPDDDAFEAEPATKPLDVSQHVLLTEPPEKVYAQYSFPILNFWLATLFLWVRMSWSSPRPSRTWCLSALSFVFISLYASSIAPPGGRWKSSNNWDWRHTRCPTWTRVECEATSNSRELILLTQDSYCLEDNFSPRFILTKCKKCMWAMKSMRKFLFFSSLQTERIFSRRSFSARWRSLRPGKICWSPYSACPKYMFQ